MTKALKKGKVDAMVTEHLVKHDDLNLIGDFDSRPFYLMAKINNNFMKEIDDAMAIIATENPYYQSELFEKYYGDHLAIKDTHFTRGEVIFINSLKKYLKDKTGKEALRVGIVLGNNPISYFEDGKAKGIRVDLLEKISNVSGIPFDYVPIVHSSKPIEYDYLRENNIDLILVEDNEINRAYGQVFETGMKFTKPLDYLAKVIVAKKGFKMDEDKEYTFAYIPGSASMNIMIKKWYPKAKLLKCDTIEECFDRVKTGKADVLMYNQYLAEKQLLHPQYSELAVVPEVTYSDSNMISAIVFKNGPYKEIGEKAVDPYLNNPLLISVLNKSIDSIGDKEIQSTIINNTIGNYSSVLSFKDFLYKYKIAISLITISVGIALIALFLLNRNKKRNNEKLNAVNEQLEIAIAKAESSSIAKGKFLSNMSHEIRTPMNAIIGLSVIARNHRDEPGKVEECLSKIESSSKVLLNILNDVLDMSAIENNKVKLVKSEFDIKAILSGVSDVYYTQCKQKGIGFSMATDIQHEIVIGDSLRLNQIMLNLVSNAFKFTDKGGKIEIKVKEYISNNNKTFFKIRVVDTGIGMSEDFKNRIFNPFEQENKNINLSTNGSGLGLSITKNLVGLMGGAINVESVEGVGTKFIVELPFEYADSDRIINDEEFKNLKVLVVDDDNNALEYISVILDRLSVSYDLAKSGEEAIALAKANKHYNMCLVDWKMPGMDGVETIKILEKIVSNNTSIIVVSAYDVSEISTKAKNIGVDMVITKPIFQSTLFNMLISMTGERQVENSDTVHKYDFGGRRVLLVEDNELNAEIATDVLEMVGVKVDVAANGQQAVELFEKASEGRYFAILMDVQMPIMDGYEATRRIRNSSKNEGKKICIYAMTANAFTEDISKSLASGMNGHISKPIDVQILCDKLEKVIEEM
ncbi:MAG: response regulator [Anaerovoracaceae bacterium]